MIFINYVLLSAIDGWAKAAYLGHIKKCEGKKKEESLETLWDCDLPTKSGEDWHFPGVNDFFLLLKYCSEDPWPGCLRCRPFISSFQMSTIAEKAWEVQGALSKRESAGLGEVRAATATGRPQRVGVSGPVQGFLLEHWADVFPSTGGPMGLLIPCGAMGSLKQCHCAGRQTQPIDDRNLTCFWRYICFLSS